MAIAVSNIRVYELGPTRWHMTINFDGNQKISFEKWMADMYPDCMCVYRSNYGSDGYYEVRGGNKEDQALVALMWGNE